MAKKVGKGIFTRSEPWQCYHAEQNGYVYYICEEKNYTADKGWKIMKREGGNEWVFIITRRKKGLRKYEGKRAYKIYESLITHRHKHFGDIEYKGYDEYAIKRKNGTLIYSFTLKQLEDGKPWDKDIEKTRLAVYYEEEYVSDYFATFRECLKYAENKLFSEGA